MTIAPDLLHTLAETQEEEVEASRGSIFAPEVDGNNHPEPKSFLNNETAYREAFARSYGGKGEAKTKQVSLTTISLFSAKRRFGLTG